MTLHTGSRLGPYEIVAPLGAGGMGEVYRAKDTRLERMVAVKVLPSHLSSSQVVRQRFEREAKTISRLSHPHICALYDVGREGETEYLVMELLEGETLSERLSKGPLPLQQSLRYGIEIADALEKAHGEGIVHRDLKPANVMLTKSGVKLLDFGLAKYHAQGVGDLSQQSTLAPDQERLTGSGTLLGTLHYMAPEQLEGAEADARADIWGLGCLLHEMVAGQSPFNGKNPASVISSIMKADPTPLSSLQPTVPPSLDHLVRACLAKDPDQRWQSSHDIGVELRWIATSGANAAATLAPGERSKVREHIARWGGLALGALTGVAIGVAAMHHLKPAAMPVRILNLALPPAAAQSATISPDGQWIAVVSNQKVLVKRIDELSWHELPSTTGAEFPLFWSPDSRRIGFPIESALKKVDLAGSRPQTICDRCVQPGSLRGASWNANGEILVGGSPEDTRLMGGLWKISENGGEMQRVTSLDTARGENTHRFPTFLPDGRRFVFTVRRDNGEHEIRVGDLAGSPSRLLVSGFSKTAYASGHLLFVRDGALLALTFDPEKAMSSGDPVKVVENVSQSVGTGSASFAVAEDGTLLFGQAAETHGYAFFDRNGKKILDVTTRQADSGGRISPDARRAVVAEYDQDKASTDIYVIDAATGARTRLTSDTNFEQFPVWSRDGERVAYVARENGRQGVNVQNAAGGNEQRVYEGHVGESLRLNDWSPDGKYLLLTVSITTGHELARLAVSDGRIEPWESTKTSGGGARFSPDGRWVAYVSSETGSAEVHVRRFPVGGETHRVSATGGDAPLWSRDGQELYYRDRDGWVVAATVRIVGETIKTENPQRLFRAPVAGVWNVGDYQHDVDGGGRFFLYRVGDETGTYAKTLSVVLNWTRWAKL